MERIAIVTSGGDAPGMNACIRAVVRHGSAHDLQVFGVCRGYQGMIEGEIIPLGVRDVGNIIQRGGTILRSARCTAFREPEGREQAAARLRTAGIDGLVVCGGNGSMQAALQLSAHWDGGIVGVPASIDNDLSGTDTTIGFDTAVNTALEAIDRIRDTAESQQRAFLVEVMGRKSGAIAVSVALAGGAVGVLAPGLPQDLDALVSFLHSARAARRASNIIIVAEGDEAGGAFEVARALEAHMAMPIRVTVLGHIQRGGAPTAASRILGTRFGAAAVDTLRDGDGGVMVGIRGTEIVRVPLSEAVVEPPCVDAALARLIVGLAG